MLHGPGTRVSWDKVPVTVFLSHRTPAPAKASSSLRDGLPSRASTALCRGRRCSPGPGLSRTPCSWALTVGTGAYSSLAGDTDVSLRGSPAAPMLAGRTRWHSCRLLFAVKGPS